MRRLTLISVFASGAWIVAASASAQTGLRTSLNVQFYQNGAILPTQTQTIPLPGGALCGQPLFPTGPPPITYITTTAKIVWTDPDVPTLNCIATQVPGSVLLALPLGANYTATATYTYDFLPPVTSAASGPSNTFTRGAPPTPAPPSIQVRP